jgi:SNF family Na+-dependent transporter
MSFYSEVAAWVFAYIFKAASGEILSTDPAVTGAAFSAHHGSLAESALAVAGAGPDGGSC